MALHTVAETAVFRKYAASVWDADELAAFIVWIAANPKAGEPRRLSVVEARTLDARRQLVLIRRDGVEHLLLLSPNAETVVETGIPARENAP